MKARVSVLISAFVIAGSAAAFAGEARVVSPQGDVRVRESVSAAPRPASDGETLPDGAWIVTGPTSSCEVDFGGSAVRVRSGTSARVVTSEPVRVDLTSGKLLAIVRGLPERSSFKIGTPTAVASARGTIFTASPDTFEAIEDDIVLTPADGGEDTVLEEGEGATFEDGAFKVTDLPAEIVAGAKEEAREVEAALAAGGAAETVAASGDEEDADDVLDGGFAEAGFGDIDSVLDARSESAELANEKERLEDKKPEQDEDPNRGGGNGFTSGG